jgi:hypothetical protein
VAAQPEAAIGLAVAHVAAVNPPALALIRGYFGHGNVSDSGSRGPLDNLIDALDDLLKGS